ncbi:hypothetical protein [Amycolatopsis sp. H20-H5]|uniref:hypothetical protein n=1 Tax=Amycolatopsis sp. H20-H5 TaxID=3046309 RepID=UPI002DBDF5EF|nr:hypothetical protein [Amycolatopsis sp. H20-H5]MEC3978794.1 hypothetical protein [Amycolatopsis sp. H20-H5]
MTPEDRELVNRMSELAKALIAGGIIRLHRERNPDQLAEDLRDLGLEFTDLGTALTTRVSELDGTPQPHWHPHNCSICTKTLSPGTLALRLFTARYTPRNPGPEWTMTADWTLPAPSTITLCEPCWNTLPCRIPKC